MIGIADLRQADRRGQRALLRPRHRLAGGGPGHLRRHRGAVGLLAALIEPGDEVVLFEPPTIATCRWCAAPRHAAAGAPDAARLAARRRRARRRLGRRTKAILVDDPIDPAGKVFTDEERALIAEFVVRQDAYAICDKVYEHIVFDGHRHRPLMTFPGMREHAVRIGSAGKTFSLTGWKVGYVTAAPRLTDPITKAHQFTTFTTPPNLQKAVAYGLGKATTTTPGSPATSRRSATASPRLSPASASPLPPAPAPTSSAPTPHRWASPTTWRSAAP